MTENNDERKLTKFAATVLVMEGLVSHAATEERMWTRDYFNAKSNSARMFFSGILGAGLTAEAFSRGSQWGWVILLGTFWLSLGLIGQLQLMYKAKELIDVWKDTRSKSEAALYQYTVDIPEM